MEKSVELKVKDFYIIPVAYGEGDRFAEFCRNLSKEIEYSTIGSLIDELHSYDRLEIDYYDLEDIKKLAAVSVKNYPTLAHAIVHYIENTSQGRLPLIKKIELLIYISNFEGVNDPQNKQNRTLLNALFQTPVGFRLFPISRKSKTDAIGLAYKCLDAFIKQIGGKQNVFNLAWEEGPIEFVEKLITKETHAYPTDITTNLIASSKKNMNMRRYSLLIWENAKISQVPDGTSTEVKQKNDEEWVICKIREAHENLTARRIEAAIQDGDRQMVENQLALNLINKIDNDDDYCSYLNDRFHIIEKPLVLFIFNFFINNHLSLNAKVLDAMIPVFEFPLININELLVGFVLTDQAKGLPLAAVLSNHPDFLSQLCKLDHFNANKVFLKIQIKNGMDKEHDLIKILKQYASIDYNVVILLALDLLKITNPYSKDYEPRISLLNTLLLNKQENINLKIQQTENEETALHKAVQQNLIPIAELMIKRDPTLLNITDKQGKKPGDYAGTFEMQALIQKYAARKNIHLCCAAFFSDPASKLKELPKELFRLIALKFYDACKIEYRNLKERGRDFELVKDNIDSFSIEWLADHIKENPFIFHMKDYNGKKLIDYAVTPETQACIQKLMTPEIASDIGDVPEEESSSCMPKLG